jgi:hypothetical protein
VKRLRGEPTVSKAKPSNESEMALFHEYTSQCAQKELDSADIVIALGKSGGGGTEDETVKLLAGIQRV